MSKLTGGKGKAILAAALLAVALGVSEPVQAAEPIPTSAQPKPAVTDTWRAVRQGELGSITIPDARAAKLIQSEGETWRSFRNSYLLPGSAVVLSLVLVALAAFYLIRGKIRVGTGLSGRMILRFKTIERFGHWLTAGSFMALGVTGLNILFGREVLLPVIGADAFSLLTRAGKVLHNFGGFAFMAGLALIFAMWVRHNLWDRYDLQWILKGGGLIGKGHPEAGKFNFGQKTQFWMVILVGILVSATGLNLMMPFAFVDLLGMQVLQVVHAVAAVLMILSILGHIYIGTIGMEGATSAMTTGYVDINWAREHHSAWVDEVTGEKAQSRH